MSGRVNNYEVTKRRMAEKFLDYDQEDPAEKRRRLREKLERLEALIAQKEECFDEHHCFL